jgi:uncharacterized membrane protein
MPSPLPVGALYDYVLGVHVIGVVLAFGWTFALPIMFAYAARQDPRSLPTLHRLEVRISRMMLNPALVVILAAGIYMASDQHHWSEFFVQWGLAAIVVIGAVVGAVMIPAAERAAAAAEQDLASYTGGDFSPGPAYQALARRLTIAGGGLWIIVLATIVIMAAKP